MQPEIRPDGERIAELVARNKLLVRRIGGLTAYARRLESQLAKGDEARAMPMQIIREVCEEHGVTRNDLLSRRRHKFLVDARRRAIDRLLAETRMSCSEIARLLNRDHSTIVHHAQMQRAAAAAAIPALE